MGNWSRNRKIRHIIWSCVPCMRTGDFIISSSPACRKTSKRSTFLMIQKYMYVYCQQLFRCVSSPDQSPQTREGQKTSDYNSIAVPWSTAILFQKLLLVVVNNNSCVVSANSETQEKSSYCVSPLGKQPSNLALEGNCLWLFLARVWQLTISRYQFAKNF